jgi:hypothetical protein
VVPGVLLADDGRLREPGWAPQQVLQWNRDKVADATKLRQWDFFTILDENAAVNLTLADLGFVQAATVGLVDFPSNTTQKGAISIVGAADTLTLSPGVDGLAVFAPGGVAAAMQFVSNPQGTKIDIVMPASFGDAATGSFTLTRPAAYLSLATPFDDDPHDFFFEQKIPGMAATGSLTLAGRTWSFGSGAVAVMDWGRGQWPSMPNWRWAAGSGDNLAFNFGEGFGNPSAATENLLIAADLPHKLAAVSWTHDTTNPMADWTFSGSGVSLTLHPLATETGGLDLGADYQHLQKAYGHFSGTITTDNTTFPIAALGFAEEVSISW